MHCDFALPVRRARVILRTMAKKASTGKVAVAVSAPTPQPAVAVPPPARQARKPSAPLDTRVIYRGDNLEQLAMLSDSSVDLKGGVYIDPAMQLQPQLRSLLGRSKRAAGVRRPPRPPCRRTSTTCAPVAPNSPSLLRGGCGGRRGFPRRYNALCDTPGLAHA